MTEQTATKYYIIETKYTWINDPGPKDTIEIATRPAHSIWTGEAVVNGGAGIESGNGYEESTVAHGEYETLEAAQDAITKIFGEVRECTNKAPDPDFGVEIYWPGEYEILSPAETREMVRDGLLDEGAELAHVADTDIPEIIDNINENYQDEYQAIIDRPACAEVIRTIREEQKEEAGID